MATMHSAVGRSAAVRFSQAFPAGTSFCTHAEALLCNLMPFSMQMHDYGKGGRASG